MWVRSFELVTGEIEIIFIIGSKEQCEVIAKLVIGMRCGRGLVVSSLVLDGRRYDHMMELVLLQG
jgi:hypothetical protein